MMVFEDGHEIGLYGLLASKLKVAMKEVNYIRITKAQTVIASLVMGCGHTKAINETLEPARTAASYLGLERRSLVLERQVQSFHLSVESEGHSAA
ncbi:MAG TPA: hypothetical protein VMT34_10380 [Aggregatilineales bacterium]|nr:hypothetical protein [Aggregatilineales bacterium]